jgi:CubicO group peptidase (beta-lactamase class C family)
MRCFIAVLLVSASAATACAPAVAPCTVAVSAAPGRQPAASAFDSLDVHVRKGMADWNVPGLAIGVVRNDSVLFAKGYGVREIGRPDPVDTRTLFGLLSPTKTFAAAALAMLADDGRLSLDDRVIEHLPGFRVADDALTADLRIRDLLSHRTGYEENHRLWYGLGGTTSDVASRAGELSAIAPPRTEFHYNNVMYVVAGEIIEAVSGMGWDEFIRERLLLPLGMTETTTSPASLHAYDNVSTPHARRFFGRVGSLRPIPYFDTSNVGPAGSMHTTVADMTAWLKLHVNGGVHNGQRLLSEEAVRELQKPHVPLPDAADPRIGGARAWAPLCGVVEPTSNGYGLGWFTIEFRGHPAVTHGGGINGQRSAVGLLPAQGVGVVILSNAQDTEISLALMYHVFDMFLDAPPRDWSGEYLRVR